MITDWHVMCNDGTYSLTHQDFLVHMAGPYSAKGEPNPHIFSALMVVGGKFEPYMIQQTFPSAQFYDCLVYLSDADFAMIKLAAS